MSDEKRNISDINDQKTIDRTEQAALDQTAEQQAFSEEIRRRLAEPDSGKPTLEEFKVMVYKDREKRRKKRSALVACLVAAFIVGFLSFDALVPEVGADKNPKETIQTEDGVIIEDGGWESSTGEDDVWVIEEWRDIKEAKVLLPKLPIPQYVPAEYKFKQLNIESFETGDMIVEYIFLKNKSERMEIEALIVDGGETALDMEDVSKERACKWGTLYIQGEDNKRATIQVDGGISVYVWGDLLEEEIVQLINNIDF